MRSQRIAEDVPAPTGWPRPHYVVDDKTLEMEARSRALGDRGAADLAPIGRVRYATWSSESAADQVHVCSNDRTYLAGMHHLCSSCGHVMTRGLMIDRGWITGAYAARGSKRVFDAHDTNYGSPSCYRCIVLALRHCPWLATFAADFGNTLSWVVTTSSADFVEFDETTAIEPVGELDRATSEQVRSDVQAGRTHVLDIAADDLLPTERPSDFDGQSWAEDVDPNYYRVAVVKRTIEQTTAEANRCPLTA